MLIDKSKLPKKTKLVVFDIDDTLTQTVPLNKIVLPKALDAVGMKNVDTYWDGYKHHTGSFVYYSNFLKTFERESSKEEYVLYIDLLLNLMKEQAKSMSLSEVPGAKAFLSYLLCETEYAVSFGTGAEKCTALLKLDLCDMIYDQDLVVGSDDFQTREEIVEESIRKACQFYDVESFEKIFATGDGIWDVKTALGMGLGFFGIGASVEKLKDAGAEVVFPDFLDKEAVFQYLKSK